ncbi:30S ribosomal protein S19e [Candidatus Pacearchaeota archaeon]|nr:30S ribosomal protein S19e [Candidatus Pacearchaeota archaeon]
MVKVYDIEAEKFILALAAELKKMPEFKMPDWAQFVKTGISKARPPTDEDWWYKRAASILRQIYTKGVVGVSRLRTKYGSKQNRGMKPKRFKKAAGKNIRVILQQAEKAGFLEKIKAKKSGRKLTEKGKEFLERISA